MSLEFKTATLGRQLQSYGKLLIAYSGGVDSALLLRVAYDELQANVLAVTADSPSVPREELRLAKRVALEIGAEHLIVRTEEFDDPNYLQNPVNRCYFCKSELYGKLMNIAERRNISTIANGTNLDDLGDYRPGLQAAEEFRIVSPLRDARFTKKDVRDLAGKLGLEIWDKPASPCLASRIPYGKEVTREKLAAIEAAEAFVRSLGIKELRVRHFDEKARIETRPEKYKLIHQNLDVIRKKFGTLGFTSVEWQEFKSGALNRVLEI